MQREFLEQVADHKEIVIATTKPDKAQGFANHLQTRVSSTPPVVPHPESWRYQEPKSNDARSVAYGKADFLRNLLLGEGKQGHEFVAVGADTIVSVWNHEQGKWEEWHQLGRDITEPNPAAIAATYRMLRGEVTDKDHNKRVNDLPLLISWQNAVAAINGMSGISSERIVVEANRLPVEYLISAFPQAVLSGSLWNMNSRLPMIEALAETDSIERVGLFRDPVDGEEAVSIVTADVSPAMIGLLKESIITTVPQAIVTLEEQN